jgi:hypothetical protein
MNRTWDENRQTINQLWPVAQFTAEDVRLWHDDLSGLDQDMLYDAIRNVKRTHDSVYPQLKWMLDEYRSLAQSRKAALRSTVSREEKTQWNIDETQDREARNELMEWVDRAEPSEYRAIHDAVFEPEMFKRLHSLTAMRIVFYARERLLGEKPQFGRVNDRGDVTPMFSSAGVDGNAPLALRSAT